MALYRKYRPQSLEDLVGQENVKNSLKSAIAGNKLAHAYLFCGPKGTGKTSTARILAKIVNCKRVQSGEGKVLSWEKIPCNGCGSCLSITDGSNLDVIEMDAASNRGIEDIRALRDTIKLAPTSALKKVYIIDEAHMLTGEAFNALLKTLEEPPSHVLFILATTEPQKLPQTILSRVQKLEFKQASPQELVEVLVKIAEGEGLKVEKDVLLILAKKAQGSFRDGVKLLDQVSSLENIDLQSVQTLLGASSLSKQMSLTQSISQSDPKKALEILAEILNTHVVPKDLTLSLLDLLRQMVLIKNGVGESLVRGEVSEDEYELLKKVAEDFDQPKLIKTINLFEDSLERVKYVSIASLPLEMAVVESCMESMDKGQVLSIKGNVISTPPKAEEKSEIDLSPTTRDDNVEKRKATDHRPLTTDSSDDIIKIQDRWTYILETVRGANFSLEALLRSAKVINCNERNVVIEVPYSFHQRIMDAPKSREVLESILSDILGRAVGVKTILGRSVIKREELQNIEVAPDDEIVRLAAEIFSSDTAN